MTNAINIIHTKNNLYNGTGQFFVFVVYLTPLVHTCEGAELSWLLSEGT